MPPARLVFWASTAFVLAFILHAALTAPPPLALALAVLCGYLAIMLAGVFLLRLRMFADAVVAGPDDALGVALTFDDGPHPRSTPLVLDLLEKHGAKATFFVIGRKVDQHPEVVAEIARRGHEIGVHGWAHDRYFALRGPRRVRRDLERAIRSIEKVTGQRPRLFRPPIGHSNPTITRVAESLGLTIVGWSVSARDGTARSTEQGSVARVKRGLRDGAIVLMHDAAERDDRIPVAPAMLPEIFDALERDNLRVTPLATWLEAD